MNPRLVENLASTPKYAQIFADASLVQAMLDFEAALARPEASLGVIPARAAEAICKAAKADGMDFAALGQQGLRGGTLSIPLVKMLRERVGVIDKGNAHCLFARKFFNHFGRQPLTRSIRTPWK